MRLPPKPGGNAAGEEKRLKLYEAILAERAAGRRPPSQRELAAVIGCSASLVRFHLRALRAQGLVDIAPGTRGISLTAQDTADTGLMHEGPVSSDGSRIRTLDADQLAVKTAADKIEQNGVLSRTDGPGPRGVELTQAGEVP